MSMAAVTSAGVLAAESGGGTDNFLIPNGTFFYILAIFLIVFGVIAQFVVKPIQKVLNERDAMIAKTAQDNRQAAEQESSADADYRKELATARTEAGSIRDQARAEGREAVDQLRGAANDEVAGQLQKASEELSAESAALTPTLDSSAEALAVTLANRVLGVDAITTSGNQGRAGQ